LASASGSFALVSAITSGRFSSVHNPAYNASLAAWSNFSSSQPIVGASASAQRAWDSVIISRVKDRILSRTTDDVQRARLLAAFAPHSGDWLNAPPLSAVGLRMSDEVIRVAAGLRLGTVLCAPHVCPCGAQVDARGIHGLSCQRSAGRHQRHALMNDIIHRALIRAGVASVREPAGTIVGSGLRPDGASLIPWAQGKCLAWDATTPDTLAASHVPGTSAQAGSAAEHAANNKSNKYGALSNTHHFVPVAIETLGPLNIDGLCFLRDLGRRISLVTNDPRETSFLLQRLSVAVQRGNAASVTGSLPQKDVLIG
jgi:hypothetical protein